MGMGLLICLFHQSVEAAVGLSGYLVAAIFVIAGAGFWVRGLIAARSHAFDRRTTEGGFLN